MPQLVTREVKVVEFKKGDILTTASGKVTVVKVDRKVKWAMVEVEESDRLMRLEQDEVWTVLRPEPTEAEKAAEEAAFAAMRLARQIESIENAIEDAPWDVLKAKEKLIANLDYRPDYHDSAYASYIAAQIEEALWAKVAQVFKNRERINERLVADGDTHMVIETLVDARNRVKDELERELIDKVSYGVSRSSNQLSNVVADITAATEAKWLRNMRWL
jgi:hypothetical protein